MFDSRTEDLTAIVNDASSGYMKEFLRQVRGSITSSNVDTLRKRAKKWIDATSDEKRKLVYKGKQELQKIYTAKHGRQPATSWGPSVLMTKICQEVAPQEAITFEQSILNSIVGNCTLTRLSDDAAESCQKGHELEPIFSKELLKLSKERKIPLEVEEICTVGTVQMSGKAYIKTSIDRVLGVLSTGDDGVSRTRKLLLTELKARVKPSTQQAEDERIRKLRQKRLLPRDGIYLEMDANNEHSFLGIASTAERLQALHHAATFSMTSCLHAVGNTKSLMSICKMNFPEELLSAYRRTLEFINVSGLNIFYRPDGDDGISASDEEMARIKRAVELHNKTFPDLHRFTFNYQVWRDLTQSTNLPLPPLKNLLPTVLSGWNCNKPTGDTITQMLWDLMFHSPKSNPQAVLVKRLAIQIPFYMCHRFFQLLSISRPLSDFSSIYQYRQYAGRGRTFHASVCKIDSMLRSMAAAYDPQPPLAPPAAQPFIQALPGTVTMAHAYPLTGSSPMRYRGNYFHDPTNANLLPFQRRHSCLGWGVHLQCDEHGNTLGGTACAECGRDGAAYWCTQCHVWLHGGPPTARQGTPTLMAAGDTIRKDNRKRNIEGNRKNFYTKMTCNDRWHHQARARHMGNATATSMMNVSLSEFDPIQHNVNTNLSFDDVTVNGASMDEAATVTSSSDEATAEEEEDDLQS